MDEIGEPKQHLTCVNNKFCYIQILNWGKAFLPPKKIICTDYMIRFSYSDNLFWIHFRAKCMCMNKDLTSKETCEWWVSVELIKLSTSSDSRERPALMLISLKIRIQGLRHLGKFHEEKTIALLIKQLLNLNLTKLCW